MRGDTNRRLTILTEAEKTALYDLPVFDDFQRLEFFAVTDAERSLALQRRGILKQVYWFHLHKSTKSPIGFGVISMLDSELFYAVWRKISVESGLANMELVDHIANEREVLGIFK